MHEHFGPSSGLSDQTAMSEGMYQSAAKNGSIMQVTTITN